MKLFIDTANVDEIREANDLGVICGVTTNPSLIAKEGKVFEESRYRVVGASALHILAGEEVDGASVGGSVASVGFEQG